MKKKIETAPRLDIHQTITDSIVAMLEQGVGKWEKPWNDKGFSIPRNAATGNAYRGVNILALMVASRVKGYSTPIWATFNQWKSLGASVRKGEKASVIVFYKSIEIDNDDEESDDDTKTILMAKGSCVFNAAQVDGYEIPKAAPVQEIDKIEAAEALMKASGATIRHGGNAAFFRPSEDLIMLPRSHDFAATAHSTAAENYYSTAFHELTHWTGTPSRLDRDLSGRFGSKSYAAEELIAELGAAFLCADLGITSSPRPDHAEYLAHWLEIMKSDNKAIFTAASKASAAASYLKEKAIKATEPQRLAA